MSRRFKGDAWKQYQAEEAQRKAARQEELRRYDEEAKARAQAAQEESDREHRRLWSRSVIYVISDTNERIWKAQDWLPPNMLVLPSGVGNPGLRTTLGPEGMEDYAGIMLDLDRAGTVFDTDRAVMQSSQVVRLIAANIAKDTPILLHGHDAVARAQFVEILQTAGFTVTQIQFEALTQEKLIAWLETCRNVWRGRNKS